MALSVFDDRSHQPSTGEVAAALGASALLWDRLVAGVEAAYYALTAEEWDEGGLLVAGVGVP